jgi:tetratricopeptide (TPR) repeat protein
MQKLSILVEFLELWYSLEERKEKFLEYLREASDETRAREASYWFLSLPKGYKKELLPQIVEELYGAGAVKLLDEFLVYEDRELKEEAVIAEFRILLEKGKYEEALMKTEEMINLNEKNAIAWFIKGGALGGLERYKEALEAFSKTVELKSEFTFAHLCKGMALGDLGRQEEALEAFSKAIQLDPEFALAWFRKGLALGDLERHEEALEAFSKAIQLDPEFALAWLDKGEVLGDLKSYPVRSRVCSRLARQRRGIRRSRET